jgi:hypothetical protein
MPPVAMPTKQTLSGLPDQLVSALGGIPGVHRAFPDPGGDRIFLICTSAEPANQILAEVEARMQTSGVEPGSIRVELAYPSAPLPTRRARFLGIEVDQVRAGWCVARVELEWDGKVYKGSAEGEAIAAGEMRSCAQATLQALESVIGGAATFNLIGIKATRIFDTELVAVLLRSEQASGQQLIGSSLVTDDLRHASALAVLNATNRLLGNFLYVSN